jgi:hypothetical protein
MKAPSKHFRRLTITYVRKSKAVPMPWGVALATRSAKRDFRLVTVAQFFTYTDALLFLRARRARDKSRRDRRKLMARLNEEQQHDNPHRSS